MAPPSEEQAIAVVVLVVHTLPVAGHICVVLAVGRGHRVQAVRCLAAWGTVALEPHVVGERSGGRGAVELLSRRPALRSSDFGGLRPVLGRAEGMPRRRWLRVS